VKDVPVSPANALREQILSLVREYCREQFGGRPFTPGHDLAHYAGRVFDAEEVCNLVDSSLDFFRRT
jgi:CDP-4-dehydro-6-deoxyglucose reductase, E1